MSKQRHSQVPKAWMDEYLDDLEKQLIENFQHDMYERLQKFCDEETACELSSSPGFALAQAHVNAYFARREVALELKQNGLSVEIIEEMTGISQNIINILPPRNDIHFLLEMNWITSLDQVTT